MCREVDKISHEKKCRVKTQKVEIENQKFVMPNTMVTTFTISKYITQHYTMFVNQKKKTFEVLYSQMKMYKRIYRF